MSFEPDPDYDLVQPRPRKKGQQCGSCGMKFDYGTGYGFYCTKVDCPMGMGPSGFGGQWASGRADR